jgi:hypothetical protein
MASVFGLRTNTWEANADGSYTEKSIEFCWVDSVIKDLMHGAEWDRVLTGVAADPILASHFDTLVGTAVRRSRWDIRDFSRRMLPKPNVDHNGRLVGVLPSSSFESIYASIEEVISSETIAIEKVWPLLGVTFQGPVNLDDNCRIQRLSRAHVVRALNSGLLSEHPLTHIEEEHIQLFGLVLTTSTKKVIGDESASLDESIVEQKKQNQLLEDVQASMALASVTPGFPGSFEASAGSLGYRCNFGAHRPRLFTHIKHVDQNACAVIKQSWRTIQKQRDRKNQALVLAVRRLWLGSQRDRVEDRLLDLMIAAEALYIGTEKEGVTGDLTYRVALHAGYWADEHLLGFSKLDTSDLLRKAYGARSKITHGGTAKDSYDWQGAPRSLAEMVNQVEVVVRQGILKALNLADSSSDSTFEPKWCDWLLTSNPTDLTWGA